MLLDLKLVVRLQEIDNRLAELAREIAALPKHIAEIEKKLGAHERKLDADRAALAANQKERKKCETDIPVQDQKISKLKDQMLSTKTNDQYRAFQNEIEFCQKEIRRLEDRILELMGECEPLEKNVKAAEAALTEEKAQVHQLLRFQGRGPRVPGARQGARSEPMRRRNHGEEAAGTLPNSSQTRISWRIRLARDGARMPSARCREPRRDAVHRRQIPISASTRRADSAGKVWWRLPTVLVDRVGMALLHFAR